MDFRSHLQKNPKSNRRRAVSTISLSSIFFFLFLVSHFVITTTIVVIATDVVDGVENDATTIEDIDESETLSEETLYSPQDIDESEEASTIENTDDLTAADEKVEEASDTISDASTTGDENDDQIDTTESDETSKDESVVEDATRTAENSEIEKPNALMDDTATEETEDNTLLSAETDTTVEDEAVEEEEEQIDSTTLSTPEKATKSRPEVIEKKKDMEGGITSPPENKSDVSGASTKSTEEKDIPKKNVMGDDSVSKPLDEQEDAEVGDEKEEEEAHEEEPAMNETASSADDQSNTENETETQDENPSSASSSAQEYPVYDDENTNEEAVIDLDGQPQGDEIDSTNDQNELEEEHSEEVTTDENDKDDHAGVSTKAQARAQAREDRRTRNAIDDSSTSIDETITDVTTTTYRGEPWGQYRSKRRLPDLDLLRLVFENWNKTKVKAVGDAESQKVVTDWQKDPLYDETIAVEAGEPFLGDEQDQEFVEYRERLLGKNNDESTSDKNPEEKTQDTENNDTNVNGNTADVNSEFVEGLDDIDKFFEGVTPPDELDVGYGSSIQDVLMDKSKEILLKKVRGVARWIQIGWQTLGRKLEERISEFELPFLKVGDSTSKASDVGTESAGASKKLDTDKIMNNTKEALVTAWRVGKQTFEVVSDFVDGLLDRFEGRGDDDSGDFDDFNGFDLDNLSTFQPPV